LNRWGVPTPPPPIVGLGGPPKLGGPARAPGLGLGPLNVGGPGNPGLGEEPPPGAWGLMGLPSYSSSPWLLSWLRLILRAHYRVEHLAREIKAEHSGDIIILLQDHKFRHVPIIGHSVLPRSTIHSHQVFIVLVVDDCWRAT
jgi:hypothetical protein